MSELNYLALRRIPIPRTGAWGEIKRTKTGKL